MPALYKPKDKLRLKAARGENGEALSASINPQKAKISVMWTPAQSKHKPNNQLTSQVVDAKLRLEKAEGWKLGILRKRRMEPGGHIAPPPRVLSPAPTTIPLLTGVPLPKKEDNKLCCEKAIKMQPKGKEQAKARIGQWPLN